MTTLNSPNYSYVNLGGTLFWQVDSGRGETQRRHVCDMGQEFGLAYDRENGVIHKHGAGPGVRQWVDETRRRLVESGEFGLEMASSLEAAYFPATAEAVEIVNTRIVGNTPRVDAVLEAIAHIVGHLPDDHVTIISR